MNHFLTPEEDLALELIFKSLGESSANCIEDAWNTCGKYLDVAERAPKLDVLCADVNKLLADTAAAGLVPFEICSFKRGDRYYAYKKFPTSISRETIRRAWRKSGMRELQLRQKRLKANSARSN